MIMTFRHLFLTICLGAAISSCSNGSSATGSNSTENRQPQPAVETTQAQKQSHVVHTGNTKIAPDSNLPTVIDFNATWCGPCSRFAPIFEAVAKEYEGKAIFLSVDVDNSPVAADQFEVSAIPQISVLLPDGTVKSTVGFMEKAQFEAFISPYIK